MDSYYVIAGLETILIGALVAGAATAAAAYFLTPNIPTGADDSGRSGNIRSAESPKQIVYGWTTKGGTLIYINGTGRDNRFLHQILIVASHEVEMIADIRLNGETVSSRAFGGLTEGITDYVNGVRDSVDRDATTVYDDNMRLNIMTGSIDQEVDPDALEENDNLTENHRARGHAGVYSRYDYDPEIFTSFIPTLTAEVFGKKILDPRDNVLRWSYNPALIIADILEDYFGVDRSKIDLQTLIDSANICDEFIPNRNGEEPRYTANGVIELDGNWEDYLTPFISAMAGAVVEWGGIYFIHAGAWTEPVLRITDADFMGPISRQVSGSDQERANAVKGTYVSPSSYDQETEFPPVRDAVAIAEDGGRVNFLELDLELVNTHTQAQRVASIALRESRLDESITITVPLYIGLDVKPFDNVTLQSDIFGFEETYRIVDHTLTTPSGRSGFYAVELTMKRHEEDVYKWLPEAQEKDIQNARTNLPGVNSNVPSLGVYSIDLLSSDDRHKPATSVVSWIDPSNDFESIEIEATLEAECRLRDTDDITEGDQPSEWEEVIISEVRSILPNVQTLAFEFEDEGRESGPYEFRNHEITLARIRTKISTNSFSEWVNLRVS